MLSGWHRPGKGRTGERRLLSVYYNKNNNDNKNHQSGQALLEQRRDTGLQLKEC